VERWSCFPGCALPAIGSFSGKPVPQDHVDERREHDAEAVLRDDYQ